MVVLSRLARRLRYLFRRADVEREMDEEMRLHIELETRELMDRGASPDDARRAAFAAFGGVERFKEEGRSAHGTRVAEDLVQDARYAWRVLAKARGFTVVSVLTLAIGIAATTAMVSVTNAMLLRPPPVREPQRLFVLAEVWKDGQRSTSTDMAQHIYPYPHYLALREASGSVFTGLAAYRYGTVALRIGSDARLLSSISTSANYFHVLGLRPALGRLYSDTSEHFGRALPEVVISHDLWQRELAGDSAIVGRVLYLNSRPVTIVGVAPAGFGGTMTGLAADVWLPAAASSRIPADAPVGDDIRRHAGAVTIFGRLQPELSVEQAVVLFGTIGSNLQPEQAGQQIIAVTLDPIVGVPAMARGATIGFTGMLFVTAALVLMIAATNIAGMLLARGAHRRREIAVRLALGAGRGRLVRQLVTESLLLCSLGGVLGVLLARWLISIIPTLQPPIGVRVSLDLGIDGFVLAVSFVVALAAALFTGLAPALQSTRFDVVSGLRGIAVVRGARRAGHGRGAFVVGQLAMSFVLLSTAGLFARALHRALLTDPGFDVRNVVVAHLDVGQHGYDQSRGESFYLRLGERLLARPEVASVALGEWTPLALTHNGDGVMMPDGRRIAVTYGVADERFLETMRIPIVEGRAISTSDTKTSAPVVLINETLARHLGPATSAIGQQLQLSGKQREVIGVVRDGKYRTLDEDPTAYAFIPLAQRYSARVTIHVRARASMVEALAAIRDEVAALDSNIPLGRARALSEDVSLYSILPRIGAWAVGVFGLIGLGLAALGIYGVISYRVTQRTRELGIRLALGARRTDIVASVLREGLAVIALGVATGIPIALVVGRVTRSFLFGVPSADPITFAAVPLLLGAAALLASYLPARRAARVDPLLSLRAE
jgi:predicted permease